MASTSEQFNLFSSIFQFLSLLLSFRKFLSLSEACRGKVMVACTKSQQRKKEESERLKGDREIRSSLLILDLNGSKL